MAKQTRSIEEQIMDSFENSRDNVFKVLSDDEFIGYITGMMMLRHTGHTMPEILEAARMLVRGGAL